MQVVARQREQEQQVASAALPSAAKPAKTVLARLTCRCR
jgi:hypothetical protein